MREAAATHVPPNLWTSQCEPRGHVVGLVRFGGSATVALIEWEKGLLLRTWPCCLDEKDSRGKLALPHNAVRLCCFKKAAFMGLPKDLDPCVDIFPCICMAIL